MSLLSFWNYVVCQINWNIHFLDWAWIKSGFSELNDLTIDIYKMAGFRLNFFKFFFWRLFLFRLNLLFFFGLFSFLWLSLLWGGLLKSEIFHLFLVFCDWGLFGLVGTHKSSQIFSIDYFWFIYLFISLLISCLLTIISLILLLYRSTTIFLACLIPFIYSLIFYDFTQLLSIILCHWRFLIFPADSFVLKINCKLVSTIDLTCSKIRHFSRVCFIQDT